MPTDLDSLTDAELVDLLRITASMATYRAAMRVRDRRAQAKAARRRAAMPVQREARP